MSESQQPAGHKCMRLRSPVIYTWGIFCLASFCWKGVNLSAMEKAHDTSLFYQQTLHYSMFLSGQLNRKLVPEVHVEEVHVCFYIELGKRVDLPKKRAP